MVALNVQVFLKESLVPNDGNYHNLKCYLFAGEKVDQQQRSDVRVYKWV